MPEAQPEVAQQAPAAEAAVVEVTAQESSPPAEHAPEEKNADCLDMYKNSFGEWGAIFTGPLEYWDKDLGELFAIEHEDEAVHLRAFSTWAIIKFYTVIATQTMTFIVIGCSLGLFGIAIRNVLMGLIFGFIFSHLFWFLVVKQDGGCPPHGYLILGILCVVGAFLSLMNIIDHTAVWDFFPDYIAVDVFDLISIVPSVFQAGLLIKLWIRKKDAAANTDAQPPVAAAEGMDPEQPEGASYCKNGVWYDHNDEPMKPVVP